MAPAPRERHRAHLRGRGRGDASAATAEASRAALDAGAREVLLFADLVNPTGNALYRRSGYVPVTDFAMYDLPRGIGSRR
ncbi:putative GNAT family acetyltransferase [Streptomyces stelliscabiei]|uniref:Putative GNAT family acetyltransferase n=1 Tax=Streptomyces stelliscabiei TaxID=146820 RepID=A0A8I0TPU1_9ACTN|nr:putative GNAT family acetyltransferase [Streptomyces stelliscabiei]